MSFNISFQRPAMRMWVATLEAQTLWFHLPKRDPIPSFDNYSKNSKARFYLDHPGSSTQLRINNLRSASLGYVTQTWHLGVPLWVSGSCPETWNCGGGGGQPFQVMLTMVPTSGVSLSSITYSCKAQSKSFTSYLVMWLSPYLPYSVVRNS